MQTLEWLKELGIERLILALSLGMPRLFAVFTVTPFLGGGILTGSLRMAIVLPLMLFIYPTLPDSALLTQGMNSTQATMFILALMLKELFIGFVLGFLVSILFWTVQSAGFLIDNQRGSSQSQTSDPISQESTSPLGSFLFQVLVYMFFSSAAFMGFLNMCFTSYMLWPVGKLLPWPSGIRLPILFAEQVSWLALYMLLLSAPVVIACFLSDFCLGLINRFAQQLNVFILSMGVKSGATAFLIFLYLYPLCHIFIDLMADLSRVHLMLGNAL
ncbi:type III secretion system export apparatus subunit SctT [Desulfospira joergensenii]|uniref:type III secretion system export apparatus subunit SctT n=1 Tax=Desulfospira joergensenii TaxID=53329 RepID=UPI0003B4236B|nr:type III secretion system export apparatus subunit SctT [Desulfospira joergensenii]